MRYFALLISISLPAFSPAALAQGSLCNPCVDPPANRSPSPVERALTPRFRALRPSLPDRLPFDRDQATARLVARAWLDLPYAERNRLFQLEGRDLEWARSMERAIRAEIAGWNQPPVELSGVECRATMCRISMLWPRTSDNAERGIQSSALYGLGIDHQGETDLIDQGDRYLWIMFARRR